MAQGGQKKRKICSVWSLEMMLFTNFLCYNVPFLLLKTTVHLGSRVEGPFKYIAYRHSDFCKSIAGCPYISTTPSPQTKPFVAVTSGLTGLVTATKGLEKVHRSLGCNDHIALESPVSLLGLSLSWGYKGGSRDLDNMALGYDGSALYSTCFTQDKLADDKRLVESDTHGPQW
eukprot:scaffold8251_cov61-Cyclotella_meneghiniana.AAC.5